MAEEEEVVAKTAEVEGTAPWWRTRRRRRRRTTAKTAEVVEDEDKAVKGAN